jgi:hypothetical protein
LAGALVGSAAEEVAMVRYASTHTSGVSWRVSRKSVESSRTGVPYVA